MRTIEKYKKGKRGGMKIRGRKKKRKKKNYGGTMITNKIYYHYLLLSIHLTGGTSSYTTVNFGNSDGKIIAASAINPLSLSQVDLIQSAFIIYLSVAKRIY